MLEVDIPSQDTFSDEMIVQLNVLSPSVKHQVQNQVNATHLVTVEEDGIYDGKVKIL